MKPEFICPKCKSIEVSKPRYTLKQMAVILLLLGFPLPFVSKEAHCFGCGMEAPISRFLPKKK